MKLHNYSFFKNRKWYLNIKVLLFLVLLLGTSLRGISQVTISGKLTDENNEPVIGASVVVKGTTNGAISNIDGEYSLQVKEGDILVFNMIGYLEEETTVTAGIAKVDITLIPDIIGLDQVIVVGYGTQRKGDLTAAIANVSADDFQKGSAKDMGQLLQGKVAGLNITTPDGNPSGNSQITLRGQVSVGTNSDVLVIIDGVPAISEKDQNGGSQSVDPLKLVAPQDIESITVLKDGSAAAIYGARGNNGVILITTKQGKKGHNLSLEYSGQVSTERISKRPDFYTADDFMRMENDTSYGGLNIWKAIQPLENPTSTDWLAEITRKPISQMHNITIKGGAENTGYVASFNYNKAQGIFIKSEVENIRTRFDINQSMFDNKLTFNIGLLSGQKTDPSIDPGLAYRNALTRNPTDRVKDESGNWQERDGFQYYNPVSMMNEETSEVKERYNIMHGSMTFNPIKGLYMKMMVSRNTWNMNRGNYKSLKHFESLKNGHDGWAEIESQSTLDNLLEFTTDYSKNIGGHTFSIMGGYSYNDHTWDRSFMKNEHFPSDVFLWNHIYVGDALQGEGTPDMQSNKNYYKLIAAFGRINYNFRDKYLLQASIRHEGSSKFGENNKWGNFPSFQVGWKVKNESFFSDVDFISELKLRFGYGVTGQLPNESYLSLTRMNYSQAQYFYYNGKWLSTILFELEPNPDLQWERKTEYNYGIDWGILNSRISGSVDYYSRLTTDLLYLYSIPVPPNRASRKWANVGSMSNKGWEVMLNIVPVQTKDFEWFTNFSYSTNKNKLESLESQTYSLTAQYLDGGYTGDPIQMGTHRMYIGQQVGDIYGYKVVGYYATALKRNKKVIDSTAMWLIDRPEIKEELDELGNVITVGQEADTVKFTAKKASDIQKLGNGIPKHFVSWNNSFRYKSFDLNISFRGAFGFQILNFERMFNETGQGTIRTAQNRYKAEYTDANDQKAYGNFLLGEAGSVTSQYVENGDYLKIDNVTLGYNFNPKESKYLRSARIYVTVGNLYTFTKYKGIDPEVTRQWDIAGDDNKDKYPTTRRFSAGIDIRF